jgi:hypothetical protein
MKNQFTLRGLFLALTLACAAIAVARASWYLTYHGQHKDFTFFKEIAELTQ